ncbi:EF-hand domain-containing protein [Saccharopolyspora erythraea]|nr:EF-hand domain-containing protein [Saccharopolyspora erythraea]
MYEFDPETFFASSDADSNGVLDRNEITALLLRHLSELDRQSAGEGAAGDAASKIEQMVEHLMQQLDQDGDGSVTYAEFLDFVSQSNLLKTRPAQEQRQD